MESPTFYVVTWHYHDHSGFGVVAIRDNADAATRLVAFLKLHCDSKVFTIHETEMEPT
jgi:hypothetical protein